MRFLHLSNTQTALQMKKCDIPIGPKRICLKVLEKLQKEKCTSRFHISWKKIFVKLQVTLLMINPLSSWMFLLKLARNNYCQKSTAILTQDATEQWSKTQLFSPSHNNNNISWWYQKKTIRSQRNTKVIQFWPIQ